MDVAELVEEDDGLAGQQGRDRPGDAGGEHRRAQDRAARLFLYRGDIEAEWVAYGPNGRTHAEAFVEGVNAYVQQVLDGREPLPVEFRLTGSRPELWSPEDVVRIRSHGLTRNAHDFDRLAEDLSVRLEGWLARRR